MQARMQAEIWETMLRTDLWDPIAKKIKASFQRQYKDSAYINFDSENGMHKNIYTYLHTYIYISMYIYMHTYIFTHINSLHIYTH